jgi:type III pantothenate kinase
MSGPESEHSDRAHFLAVDVGNSRTKCAVCHGRELFSQWSFPTSERSVAAAPDGLRDGWRSHGVDVPPPGAVVVASVVDGAAKDILQASEAVWGVQGAEVTSRTDLGLVVDVPRPEIVGVDRLLGASEAFRLFGGPVVVASLGTVTALSAVTGDGRFVGGALCPGAQTAAWSVHARTSRLPDVSPSPPVSALGTDTQSAICSGVVYGTAGALDRLASELAGELGGRAILVLTGGESGLLSPLLRMPHTVEPDLVLRGLASVFLGGAAGA